MSLILNLVYPEKSDVKYDIVRFSDSQIQFTLKDWDNPYIGRVEINIYSRMSWNDVQVIAAAMAALREHGVETVRLYVPYFLGGRSDRKFQTGGINYIKTVIAPIINSLDFNEVVVLDPHSDVLEGCLDVYTKQDNTELVKWAFEDIPLDLSNFVLISPDAGALKKIYNVADSIHKEYGIYSEIVVASKYRDVKTGKILSTDVPMQPSHALKDFIIVDDIADGGRTFIEIAKKIKETFPNAKVYLIVTHGIFSQGFGELAQWFTRIYTTNSIQDFGDGTWNGLHQFNLF